VNCGKTADSIWMPFGVVSTMGVLDGVEIVEEGAVLGVNMGHPIVTNGTLQHIYVASGVATRLFPNYFGISCYSSLFTNVYRKR